MGGGVRGDFALGLTELEALVDRERLGELVGESFEDELLGEGGCKCRDGPGSGNRRGPVELLRGVRRAGGSGNAARLGTGDSGLSLLT